MNFHLHFLLIGLAISSVTPDKVTDLLRFKRDKIPLSLKLSNLVCYGPEYKTINTLPNFIAEYIKSEFNLNTLVVTGSSKLTGETYADDWKRLLGLIKTTREIRIEEHPLPSLLTALTESEIAKAATELTMNSFKGNEFDPCKKFTALTKLVIIDTVFSSANFAACKALQVFAMTRSPKYPASDNAAAMGYGRFPIDSVLSLFIGSTDVHDLQLFFHGHTFTVDILKRVDELQQIFPKLKSFTTSVAANNLNEARREEMKSVTWAIGSGLDIEYIRYVVDGLSEKEAKTRIKEIRSLCPSAPRDVMTSDGTMADGSRKSFVQCHLVNKSGQMKNYLRDVGKVTGFIRKPSMTLASRVSFGVGQQKSEDLSSFSARYKLKEINLKLLTLNGDPRKEFQAKYDAATIEYWSRIIAAIDSTEEITLAEHLPKSLKEVLEKSPLVKSTNILAFDNYQGSEFNPCTVFTALTGLIVIDTVFEKYRLTECKSLEMFALTRSSGDTDEPADAALETNASLNSNTADDFLLIDYLLELFQKTTAIRDLHLDFGSYTATVDIAKRILKFKERFPRVRTITTSVAADISNEAEKDKIRNAFSVINNQLNVEYVRYLIEFPGKDIKKRTKDIESLCPMEWSKKVDTGTMADGSRKRYVQCRSKVKGNHMMNYALKAGAVVGVIGKPLDPSKIPKRSTDFVYK